MKNIEKHITAARRLAKEVDENGIPDDLEDGELAYMLTTLADLCERQQEAVKALDETLKAFDHCNEVYVPQLKLSALVRERAEGILEKLK